MATNEKIIARVKESPGIRLSDLASDLGLNYNTCAYWVDRMTARGELKARYDNRKVRVYPRGE
jgi:predicted transcriptional regulator